MNAFCFPKEGDGEHYPLWFVSLERGRGPPNEEEAWRVSCLRPTCFPPARYELNRNR